MVVGAIVAFVWGQSATLSGMIYEMVPGFFSNLVVAVIVSILRISQIQKLKKNSIKHWTF